LLSGAGTAGFWLDFCLPHQSKKREAMANTRKAGYRPFQHRVSRMKWNAPNYRPQGLAIYV
jgi:hypothetical protein